MLTFKGAIAMSQGRGVICANEGIIKTGQDF